MHQDLIMMCRLGILYDDHDPKNILLKINDIILSMGAIHPQRV